MAGASGVSGAVDPDSSCTDGHATIVWRIGVGMPCLISSTDDSAAQRVDLEMAAVFESACHRGSP
jgi:hypothetical protein